MFVKANTVFLYLFTPTRLIKCSFEVITLNIFLPPTAMQAHYLIQNNNVLLRVGMIPIRLIK